MQKGLIIGDHWGNGQLRTRSDADALGADDRALNLICAPR